MNPVFPVQLINVGSSRAGEGIQVPLFRLPFVGGQDGFSRPGGFYVTKDGEFGVAIDMRLSAEEAQPFITEELRKNAAFIATALASKEEKASKSDEEKASKSDPGGEPVEGAPRPSATSMS